MTLNLGRLQKVDIREFWKDEARQFTPWLAEESNLIMLGDDLNLDLELVGTEVSVGSFSADIVANVLLPFCQAGFKLEL